MLPSCRQLFEIPDDIAYLNCAYMSPLLRSARIAGERGVALKCAPWELQPPEFFSTSERTRSLIADVIHASVDDVAFVPAVSYGMSVAAANLPLARSQKIVTLAEQFPSNVYPWVERAREVGATVIAVPRPGDHDWTEAVLERIGTDTAVVAVPAVHWADGTLLELRTLRRRCDEVGAALVLDLAQSLGAMPFDARDIRPDFMVAPTYKWLMGPYSMGFLYVDPKWQNGRPIEQGWIGRAGSEDFAALIRYRDEYQPGARRFDVGERANFALMPMVEAGLEQLLEWGIGAIYETLRARNRELAREAEGRGFEVVPERFRGGHYLSLRRPGGLPDDLVAKLGARKVFVSRRGACLRVTQHLYNSELDIERFFDALADLSLPQR